MTENQESSTFSLFLMKLFLMIVLYLMTLVIGNLSLSWARMKKGSQLMSWANITVGGLFFSLCFFHLSPEANRYFKNYSENSDSSEEEHAFSMPNFVIILSFTFVLLFEKILYPIYLSRQKDKQTLATNNLENQVALSPTVRSKEFPLREIQNGIFFTNENRNPFQIDLEQRAIYGLSKISSWVPYYVQVGLGIHAISDGVSVGANNYVKSCFLHALVMSMHKFAEDFTFGMTLGNKDVDNMRATTMIKVQALLNPLGIIIGWIFSDKEYFLRALVLSISGGILLFVGLLDIVVKEFSVEGDPRKKYYFFFGGVSFIFILLLIEDLFMEN